MCNPRTVDGRHLRHSGGPWGPSNPGGRRSYFPCELSASVTLEYEKEGGPASANYGAVPASRGGDRSTGGTAPDATRHCCRSRPTATETSVERPLRTRRSRTWPFGGDWRRHTGGCDVRRGHRRRRPPPTTSRALCGPPAAVAASTFAPNEAVQVLNVITFRTTTTMARDGAAQGGRGGRGRRRAGGGAGGTRACACGGRIRAERAS